MLFKSLALSHVNYANIIWGTPSTHTERLSKAIKKGVRVICGARPWKHSSPLFAKTGILKYEDIYKQNVMKFAWTVVNQKALKVNSELFSVYQPTRRQGPSKQLYEPFSRTSALKNLPTASIPNIWNQTFLFFREKNRTKYDQHFSENPKI